MGCQDRLSIIFQWTAISEYHTDTFVDVKILHGYNIFIKLYADCILSNWPELNLVLSNLNLTSLVDSRLYGPSESSKVDVELPPIKNLIVFFLILENINTGTLTYQQIYLIFFHIYQLLLSIISNLFLSLQRLLSWRHKGQPWYLS